MYIAWKYLYEGFGAGSVRWTVEIGTWSLCITGPHSDSKMWNVSVLNVGSDARFTETFNGTIEEAKNRAVDIVLETMSPWIKIARDRAAAATFDECAEIAVAEQREAARMRNFGVYDDIDLWRGYDRAAQSIEHAIRSAKDRKL